MDMEEAKRLAQAIWEADHEDQPMPDKRIVILRPKPGYDWVAVLPGQAVWYFYTDEDAAVGIYIFGGTA